MSGLLTNEKLEVYIFFILIILIILLLFDVLAHKYDVFKYGYFTLLGIFSYHITYNKCPSCTI